MLRLQPLNHYSDFDGTSESEQSDISIVLPYNSRLRAHKPRRPSADGQIRRKNGSRAIRRYENEAYLSTLVMITEADTEYEADDYRPDKEHEDTGFKCLFDNDDIRVLWDAFITLSERDQIELLGSLALVDAAGKVVDDVYLGDETSSHPPPSGYNCNQCDIASRSANKGRCRPSNRRKAAVMLQEIEEDLSEAAPIEAFEALDFSLDTSASRLPTPTLYDSTFDADSDSIVDDDGAAPPPGYLSSKLRDFVRASVSQRQQQQRHRGGLSKRKKRQLSLQDLCLMQRAEGELRWVFGGDDSGAVRIWTPSTSLLKPVPTGLGYDSYWVRGQPLSLNGFQRMLVHATATYLGLHSLSTWNDSFADRQLWVDSKRTALKEGEEALVMPAETVTVSIRKYMDRVGGTPQRQE